MYQLPKHYAKTLRMYANFAKGEGRKWGLEQLKDVSGALSYMAANDADISERDLRVLVIYGNRVRQAWFAELTKGN